MKRFEKMLACMRWGRVIAAGITVMSFASLAFASQSATKAGATDIPADAVACAQTLNEPGLNQKILKTFVQFRDKIEFALSQHRGLQFSATEEAAFQSIWSDAGLTDEQKLQSLYQTMTETRINNANPVTAFFMRGAVRDVHDQQSIYARTMGRVMAANFGPHYNPIFNRISYNPKSVTGLQRTLMKMHETEHAWHRNTNPLEWAAMAKLFSLELFMVLRTPFTPTFTRHMEARAIGSQWELVQRIPPQARELLADQLRQQFAPERMAENDINEIVQSGLWSKATALLELALGKPSLDDADREFLMKVIARSGGRELRQRRATVFKGRSNINDPLDRELFVNMLYLGFKSEFVQEWMTKQLSDENSGPSPQNVLTEDQYKQLKELLIKRHGSTIDERMAIVFEACLRNANLTKGEFIQKIAPMHGYSYANLLKRHYMLSTWRTILLVNGTLGAFTAYAAGTANPHLMAVDLNFLYRMLACVVGFHG